MRKWRFNRKVSSKETALLAFLAAAAVHALFLLPGYRTVNTDPDRRHTGVEILNMSALSPREFGALQNWIRIHDPARAARSGSPSGYSAHLPRRQKYSVPVEPFAEETHSVLPAMRPFKAAPVSASLPPRPPLPEETVKAPAAPLKTAVFDGSGRRLDIAPQLPPGAGSSRPTILSLRKTGKVFVASPLQGSGNPLLDRIAHKSALQWKTPRSTLLIFVWPEVKK